MIKKLLVVAVLLSLSVMPVVTVLASTEYESYTDSNTAASVETDVYRAQTFTPAVSHTITSVKVLVYRVGSPGTVDVFLVATSAGHPNPSVGYRTNTFDGDTITVNSAGEWIEITFASYTLSAGVKYAIILRAEDGNPFTDYLMWRYDSTSPTYAGGNFESSSDGGANWTSFPGRDFAFSIWGEAIVDAPTVTTQAVSAIGATTATGNGNITATGGENATKRGVCYNTTGNPTIADSKVEEAGSFGTGAFTASLIDLDVGETYYVKAYAYNSGGYSYGAQVDFTTDFTVPNVTIGDASNITVNAARLNSTLLDDGGEDCDIRFGYSLDNVINFAVPGVDDVITDWVGGYSSGQNPYYNATSLAVDTLYYFKVQADNSEGTVTSDINSFTTEATLFDPTNFKALPEGTYIDLSWVRGVGATTTLIHYAFTDYAEADMFTDGTQLYLGTSSSVTHTGLSPGTIVYYYAWSYGEAAYSDGVALSSTTTAGTTTGIDEAAPTEPTNWFLDTDYTTMSNFEPAFGTMNDIADGLGMPRNTAWMLAVLIGAVLLSLLAYNLGHQSLLAAGITMVVCISIASAQHLLPLYTLLLVIVVVIGVGFTRRNI